jgi:hypothetical protein
LLSIKKSIIKIENCNPKHLFIGEGKRRLCRLAQPLLHRFLQTVLHPGSKVQGRSQMGFHLEETPLIKGMLLDWILAGNPVLST